MFGGPLIPTGFLCERSTQTFLFGVKEMPFWVSMANAADVLQRSHCSQMTKQEEDNFI